MDFGSVIGGVVGGVGSVIGSIADNIQKEQAATVAYERSKEFYQNRHQWEIEDLKKAGLNPILSVGGQPPTSSAQMSSGSDYQTGAVGAVNSAISVLNASADLDNKAAMNAKIRQDESTSFWQAQYYKSLMDLTGQNAVKVARENNFYLDNPNVYRDLMVNSARPSNVWGLGYNIYDALRNSDLGRSVGRFFGGK